MKRPFVWFRQNLPDNVKRRGNKCNCVADDRVCVNPGDLRGAPRGMRFAHPGMTALAFEQLVGDDLDAEARKTLVVVHGGGEMPDRGDAEIAQDLCTDADFTPLPVAVCPPRAPPAVQGPTGPRPAPS